MFDDRRGRFQREQLQGFIKGAKSEIQLALQLHDRRAAGGGFERLENLLNLLARRKSGLDEVIDNFPFLHAVEQDAKSFVERAAGAADLLVIMNDGTG